MRTFSKPVALAQARQTLKSSSSSSLVSGYGRAASYRRIHSVLGASSRSTYGRDGESSSSATLTPISARSSFNSLPSSSISSIRPYTTSQSLFQQAQRKQKPQAAEESQSQTKKTESTESTESATQDSAKAAEAKDESDEKSSSESSDKQESEGKEKDTEGEEKDGKDGKEKKEDAPPPPHGDKTPWQVFMDTLQTEFKSSKEWNEGTQALSSGYQEVASNPALQKAKAAYEESLKATSSTAAAAAKVVGKGASAVWESPVGKVARKGASVAVEGLDKATKPVRETEAFKSIKNTIDDGSSSRYGGWIEKDERKRRRALREAEFTKNGGTLEKMEEDPEAGTNVTLHKDAAWKESWREFRQSSKLFQQFDGLKSVYEQSDNPLVSTARAWADTIGGFFAENETAMVIKKLREMDPSFQLEPFLIEMREYILPEVLDAYVKGDVVTLKQWLSAAQYNVYAALMQQYTTQGLKSDGRILDIRNVDVANARLLDPGEVPVFVITCRTQEVHVYKNKKTGELAAGVDDKVQQVTYAIGVTRIAEDVNNPETRGWRLIELQKSARDYY